MESAILSLRGGTHEQHLSLESFLDLVSPRLTADRYAEIIACFTAFYAWLEPELDKQLAGAPFAEAIAWAGRHKLPKLEADRQALQARGIASALPVLTSVRPDLSSVAACVGATYVTEGATLGGQYIGPHVADLGFGAAHFFRAYGNNVGNRWQQFRRAANEALATPDEVKTAVEAAQQTFAALEALFRSHVRPAIVSIVESATPLTE